MDETERKHRLAVLFQEECRLFAEYVLVKLGLKTWTIEERYRWKNNWNFAINEMERLRK